MPPAARAPDSGEWVVFEPQKTHSRSDTVTWSEDSGCMLPVHVPALSTMVRRSQMKIRFLNSFDAISMLNNGAFTLTEAENDNFYQFQYPTALVSRCSMNTSTQYVSPLIFIPHVCIVKERFPNCRKQIDICSSTMSCPIKISLNYPYKY